MITGLMQTGFTNMAAAVAAIPIHPTSASTIADSVDHLYYFLTGDHPVLHLRHLHHDFLFHDQVSPPLARRAAPRTPRRTWRWS